MKSTSSFTVIFDNIAQTSVDVIWLDFNGGERFYKRKLSHGSTVSYITYMGHIWIVRDSQTNQSLAMRSTVNAISASYFEGEKFGAEQDRNITVKIIESVDGTSGKTIILLSFLIVLLYWL